MPHIDFDVKHWIDANPNGKLDDLVKTIKAAKEVYCGWTIDNAELIRQQKYPERTDLSENDSHNVISESTEQWDAAVGYKWDDLYSAYDRYVKVLDCQS